MKIEKISENQIRCTLTREDLASRKIDLHELAYGSEKAKLLFQDMMQEAFREYGFSAENSPLMIEAIPLSGEAIVLIITRVDNPEELDSRFARFSGEDQNAGQSDSVSPSLTSLDDILNLISRLTSGAKNQEHSGKKISEAEIRPLDHIDGTAASASPENNEMPSVPAGEKKTKDGSVSQDPELASKMFRITRFFLFRDLETVISAAKVVSSEYNGWNTLFKNPDDGNYYLILRMENTSPEQFNRVCNVLTEYGVAVDYTSGMEEFFTEHMTVISEKKALEVLRGL